MSHLFDPCSFAGIPLRNKFVRSATMENMATVDRVPSERLLDLYEELACGEVGMIITSSVRPHQDLDKVSKGKNLCIGDDRVIPEFTELVGRVHRHGSKIAMQLGSFFRYEGDMVAPSADSYLGKNSSKSPRKLEVVEIQDIVDRYGKAGKRARKAGFDAVEIHAAHGFPLSQFLSPLFNKRADKYGGSKKNRVRILLEIIESISGEAGKDWPIFVKMNTSEFLEGGFDINDAIDAAQRMAECGLCAIEASGGMPPGHHCTWLGPTSKGKWVEGYFREYAAVMKAKVSVPIMLVGGLRDLRMIEEISMKGEADLFSLCRPFIREPHLVKRWRAGDKSPAKCISCNGCSKLLMDGDPVHCVLE